MEPCVRISVGGGKSNRFHPKTIKHGRELMGPKTERIRVGFYTNPTRGIQQIYIKLQ